MTFVKGYKQTKEHQENAKASRRSKRKKRECVGCGRPFYPYSDGQVTCGTSECNASLTVVRYHELKTTDPVLHKAKAISGSIRLGKNKSKIIKQMLLDVLGTPCEYCGVEITLENASMDHKEPRANSKVRVGGYTSEELRFLDRRENLHIVCKKCNNTKSDFSDDQFIRLLRFMEDNIDLKDKLLRRLNRNPLTFKRFKNRA